MNENLQGVGEERQGIGALLWDWDWKGRIQYSTNTITLGSCPLD